MQGDDPRAGFGYTDDLAHRTMTVSAVAATIKSP
jgi:hypothetical protein